jgi:pimeloyl-ACP methyl ester carboxylesterase
MEWMLGPFMRAFDRVKIVTTPRKRPRFRHRPPAFEFGELTRPEYLDDPGLFYSVRTPIADLRPAGPVRPVEPGVEREHFTYPTNLPLGHEINNIGHAVHTRRTDGRAVGSMIVLAGWARRDLDRELGVCLELARRGVETLILVLPYHLQRSIPGGFSGEFMVSGDLVRTARCFQQCVAEARGVLPWLRARTAPGLPVGILGISLGGILAHIAMCVERYDFGISMVSGGRSAGITWDSPVTHYIRQDMVKAGIGRSLLERVWAPASPVLFAHKTVTRPVMMLAGRYDEVVPARYAEELWVALGRPEIHWYPCAHYSAFFYIRPMLDRICDFIRRTGASDAATGAGDASAGVAGAVPSAAAGA